MRGGTTHGGWASVDSRRGGTEAAHCEAPPGRFALLPFPRLAFDRVLFVIRQPGI